MEDSWIYVDDDDSSYCSLTDSDKIDSETEAELYSKIHHESNLSSTNSDNLAAKPSESLICPPFNNGIFYMDNRKNISTPIEPTGKHRLPNQITYNNFSCRRRKSSEMDGDCKISEEKISPKKKHKSKSMCQSINRLSDNLENLNDSFHFRINDIQNKNTVFNLNPGNKFNNESGTIILDSSDSDSDIWIEPSSTQKSDLKINLLKDIDTVFLSSSESDNELDVSSPFVNRKSALKNLSMPNIKTDGNSKDLWHINYEDLHRLKKHSRRYHDNFDVTCSNCNRKGHTSRICPSPRIIKCFVCGGNHMGFRCLNRICSNCHTFGHDRKNCWREVYRRFCYLCKMGGHAKGNCPDLWRRYHLTTSPFNLKKGKQVQQNTNLYCWNCGKNGHFGAVCPVSNPSRNSFSTWPCVISYDNPKNLLKNRLSVLRKYPCLNMEKLNKNLNNISSLSSENKDIHLKPSNELISSRYNEENRRNKKRKKKSERIDLKFNKTQDMKEGGFPRTPKKKSPIKCSTNFGKSEEAAESLELLIKKNLQKLKKQWNKEAKRVILQVEESHEIPQNDLSKIQKEKFTINSEDDLPETAKLQIRKKFSKWIKNRKKFLKKRKQSILKGRELTKL